MHEDDERMDICVTRPTYTFNMESVELHIMAVEKPFLPYFLSFRFFFLSFSLCT